MIDRKHRIIAALLLCMMLFSVMIVPISHAKKGPAWLLPLWIIYTTALDVLDGIERAIGILTEDLDEMKDAVAEANEELQELYDERAEKEEEIKDVQGKLDALNSEESEALQKRSDAEYQIGRLESDISQTEADLAMLSPGEYSAREALEGHLSILKSALESAKQDVKDANKIINSNWRSMKKSFYASVITRLERNLSMQGKADIYRLEAFTDNLRPKIAAKQAEIDAQEPARQAAQKEVDAARKAYEDAKKSGEK